MDFVEANQFATRVMKFLCDFIQGRTIHKEVVCWNIKDLAGFYIPLGYTQDMLNDCRCFSNASLPEQDGKTRPEGVGLQKPPFIGTVMGTDKMLAETDKFIHSANQS
ncbi:MAG: hypothetical protein V1913_06165 [Fibrobacterota bacterium]